MKHKLCEEISSVLYFQRNLTDFLHFCHQLEHNLLLPAGVKPVILCIGTDRMTGDCLGPLVGHRLEQYYQGTIPVLGTLKHPVHALNLARKLEHIRQYFTNSYLIVVDASLGLPEHIGYITLTSGALHPGEGMKKKLPPVGDLSITGIVNSCRGNPSLLLQNTRLHLVNELADFIATGLMNVLG